MAFLFSTKYPNLEQVVSGTYTVDDEDSVLKCDTSTAAVTINLNSIPSGYWNTVYKLYVLDNSNLAGTNNITIVAPTGFTINNAASVVINVNGGSCIVRISADTKYTGTLNYTPGTTNTDTGWLDLLGFSWITTASLVPQYRVINNNIYFRRNLVIPLVDGGGSVVNYATDATYGTTYVDTALIAPYTGVSNGVTPFAGGCYFNNGAAVIPTAHFPDADYESAWIIGSKTQVFQYAGSPNAAGQYYSVYILTLTTAGLLKLETLNSRERIAFPSQDLGNSLLRQISSKSIISSYGRDFNDVVDSMTVARTLNGSLITNYDFPQINSLDKLHITTFDPADQTQFGAMQVPLMNFSAFKAP